MSRTQKIDSIANPDDMPVMDLALVLKQLLQKEAQIDRMEVSPAPNEKQDVELWRRTNLQAVDGIERAIAAVAARALPEAAIQILIASGYAATLADEMRDPADKEIVGRIARLLRSALPVIGVSAGLDLQAFGADRYGQGRRSWPFCPAAQQDRADAADDAVVVAEPAAPAEPSEPPAHAAAEANGATNGSLRLVDAAEADDAPFEDGEAFPQADDELGLDEQASAASDWLEISRDVRLTPVLSQILAEVGLRPQGA